MFELKKTIQLFSMTLALLVLSACNTTSTESPLVPIISDATFDESESSDEREYKQSLDELLAMRDSLNRLVALESDLSFLLDEMSKVEEQNPTFGFEEGQELSASQASVVFTPDGKSTDLDKNDLSTLGENVPGEKADVLEQLSQEELDVEKLKLLGKDAPAEDAALSEVSNEEGKFMMGANTIQQTSRLTGKPSNYVPILSPAPKLTQLDNDQQASSSSGVNSKKFSAKGGGNFTIKEGCSVTIDKDSNISVHLASYSTRLNVSKGWAFIQNEYSTELCGTFAKVAEVVVNNKLFFSLRVGGYASDLDASNVCNKLRAKGQYCKVADFMGENL